jgi:hypothetical protein
MKLFRDIIKDAGLKQVHSITALGNENYKFGPLRSQPMRDKKRLAANRVMAELSEAASAKSPDYGLEDEEAAGDIVRAGKSWKLPLEIKKYQPDKQLIFGWASVVEKDGKAVIDKQGDIIPVEELENAAYEFTLNSRNHGDMHARRNMGKLVESMVFTADKQAALGINIGQVGWWVGFKVHDDELWEAHKRGERPEFSIGGAAIPVEVT